MMARSKPITYSSSSVYLYEHSPRRNCSCMPLCRLSIHREGKACSELMQWSACSQYPPCRVAMGVELTQDLAHHTSAFLERLL
jgi:hypothetical protein